MNTALSQNQNQQDFWNSVKGIGILCIVMGHSFGAYPKIVRFVYLFHLALFFFVSGFLYTEAKYGDAPYLNFSARLRSMWPRYVVYMSCFVLLHNVFLDYGIIIESTRYGFDDVIVAIVSSIVFAGSEAMGGALWFVPVLLVASGLFGLIIYAGRVGFRVTKRQSIKGFIIILLSCLVGWIGCYSNQRGMYFIWHIQTSLLVVPLFTFGYLIRTYVSNWMNYLLGYGAILAGGILFIGIDKLGWEIELAMNKIHSPIWFYCISILGIYFILCTAKFLYNKPLVGKLISLSGKYSFDIMACHILVFKGIDLVYARIIGETNPLVLGDFPCAYSQKCCLVYALLGWVLPVFFRVFYERLCVNRKHLVVRKLPDDVKKAGRQL